MPEWAQLVAQIGFPSAACLGLALGLWRAASWVGQHIAIPLKTSLESHLKTSEETQRALVKSVGGIEVDVKEIKTSQAKHIEICEGHH